MANNNTTGRGPDRDHYGRHDKSNVSPDDQDATRYDEFRTERAWSNVAPSEAPTEYIAAQNPDPNHQAGESEPADVESGGIWDDDTVVRDDDSFADDEDDSDNEEDDDLDDEDDKERRRRQARYIVGGIIIVLAVVGVLIKCSSNNDNDNVGDPQPINPSVSDTGGGSNSGGSTGARGDRGEGTDRGGINVGQNEETNQPPASPEQENRDRENNNAGDNNNQDTTQRPAAPNNSQEKGADDLITIPGVDVKRINKHGTEKGAPPANPELDAKAMNVSMVLDHVVNEPTPNMSGFTDIDNRLGKYGLTADATVQNAYRNMDALTSDDDIVFVSRAAKPVVTASSTPGVYYVEYRVAAGAIADDGQQGDKTAMKNRLTKQMEDALRGNLYNPVEFTIDFNQNMVSVDNVKWWV